MWMLLLRAVIAGVSVAVVTELASRAPRIGALVLSLPIISILAFLFTWATYRDVHTIARLSRETLVLVPLGLVFFVPLAAADRLELGFWKAFVLGIVLAAIVIGLWLRFGPRLG